MIVLLETVHPEALAMLERAGEVRVMASPAELDADLALASVRAVLTRGRGQITAELLRRLPHVEVVGRCGAGLDNIDTDAARAAGVPVVYAPGSTTHAVSEHALMLMLAVARRMTMLDGAVKRGMWEVRNGYEGYELRGKRLGIIGLGAIGRRIAEFARMLEMDVCYWSRSSRDPNLTWMTLDDVITSSDVIQICVAATPQTHRLIGAEQFARMRPGTLVVNTARGQIVDHGALQRALDSGIVAGYGTDVWAPEPPAAADDLLQHEGVVVTPHVAALTDVTYREICARPAAAAIAILAGEEPDPSCVYESEVSP